jgi:leader peptidase (prepilin peptidase)/N-methyltransferase
MVAAVLGALAGAGIDRAAARFPWPAGAGLHEVLGRGPGAATAVRRPVLEVGTALLLVLVALRFGLTWQLPAFLLLAGTAVLLAVVDLQHRVLPNRVLLPAFVGGAVLLLGAAAGTGAWGSLTRAVLGALALFAVFLGLALISPSSLGMGDVKLAGLLGLYLGWLGWGAVLAGGVAGFLVQAGVAVALLAARRVRRDSELPFGPAMLVGAALVMALPSS